MMCDAPEISRSSRLESAHFSFENVQSPHGSAGAKEFRDGDDCPLMVALPAGEFIMGENKEDKFANETERPAHQVRIASSFSLGKFPVTVAQFLKFRAAESSFDVRCSMFGVESPRTEGHNLPIVRVSWHDATAYCEWLTAQTDRFYRLPTEAEWEFACRSGTNGPFFFGDEISVSDANFLYDEQGLRAGLGHRTPVGNFGPNAFGLHDMHGNVCEWVVDTWHPDYNGAPADGTAWIEQGNSQRVIRGGAWDYLPRLLRSPWRDWRFASYRADNIGFRVATIDLRNFKEV